ncbi:MAG: conjugative transfer system coupling protein TraD [Desulfovibrio sp.]|uniref:conjugative transfer system coupling protein TraD n=1 Tax=Desulfovibrio sp. TaxID=885 RepID=UPI00135D35C4|nr:conjugative transfer system coupling protein TraD [Desulfovibrio sp.]MTJ93989.1 conjugative transfer system coupling protein TraD [Desulfovibrio sp.]
MKAEYENPFRPPYEFLASGGMVASGLAILALLEENPLPMEIRIGAAAALFLTALVRGRQGWKVFQKKRRLTRGKRFLKEETEIELDDVREIARKNPKKLWIGKGFEWSSTHRQLMKEVQDNMDETKLVGPLPKGEQSKYRETKGAVWVHGLEEEKNEKDIFIPLPDLFGHLLIVGTTRAGKSVFLSLAIAQAIERGECVIVIDPKGDPDLRAAVERACIAAGRADQFVWFHPAFPEKSARLDPLCTFNRVTELASRIASLIPSSRSGGDSFVAFSQRALNAVVNGLLQVGTKPSLIEIRRALESPAMLEELTWKALDAYCVSALESYPSLRDGAYQANAKSKGGKRSKCDIVIGLYRQHVQPSKPNTDLEGLISQKEHPHEHFGKMIAVLLPILDMLTSGPLAQLLSPEYFTDVEREMINIGQIIAQNKVLYLGLDCLSDAMVGSCIGAMFLSDLATMSGQRYNYGTIDDPVNLYIDEGAEVGKHIPFIQLLNKSGGAKFRITIAVQTIADFAAALGNKDMATQVLGNENSWIALRLRDGETQKYLADNLPETTVQYVMNTQGSSSKAGSTEFDANLGERLMQEPAELYPSAMFGKMPTCEFVGNICGQVVKGRIPFIKREEIKQAA